MEIQKTIKQSLSIPLFLLSVFKEVMLENPCNHKLLVIALHSIFIESGFVQFDAGSGTRADRFHLSAEWPTTSPTVSLLYTLPAILQNGTNGLNGVILTFSSMGRCINVYTNLFVGGSDPYRAHLSTDLFGPIVRSLYDNDGTVVERKVVAFWNAVKDGIVLPVLTDLCAAAGLPAPANFMKLPEVIQLKILELLPAEDLAMMSCVCKGLRDVVDDDELWRQKVYDEFGDEVLFPPN